MVFALGTSMPVSMIVVHSSTLKRCWWKSRITRSSSRSGIWPCAIAMRASGTSSAELGRAGGRSCRPRCAGNRPGRRASVRAAVASRIALSDSRRTKVLIASRFCGAVAITEKSRMPSRLIASVRGIGVAVSVSTSTSARSAFNASFWRTPKRCSSSMMTSPRRGNVTPRRQQLVRADDDVDASGVDARRSPPWISFGERKRDSSTSLTGRSAKRSEKVWKCCSASSVVGAQDRDLLAVGDRDIGGAQRHLGLAEADVAAHQPVHRLAGHHVLDHRVDRRQLVGRLLERESVGERLVVVRAEAERMPGARGTARVEIEQFRGGVARAPRRARARLVPLVGAELVQRRILGAGAAVAADHVQLRHRHVQRRLVGVGEVQELGRAVAEVHRQQPFVAADAVLRVDHRVADLQFRQIADDRRRCRSAIRAGRAACGEPCRRTAPPR